MGRWAVTLLGTSTAAFIGSAQLAPESPWDPYLIALGSTSLLGALGIGVVALAPRAKKWWELRHGGWSPNEPMGSGPIGHVVAVSSGERDVLDLNPEEMTAPFRYAMTFDAQQLVQKYIGHWLRVSGQLGDIQYIDPQNNDFPIAWAEFSEVSPVHIAMTFHGDELRRLKVLRRGTPLTVVGEITDIDRHRIGLIKCKIEHVGS